jgi:hypothetical protein
MPATRRYQYVTANRSPASRDRWVNDPDRAVSVIGCIDAPRVGREKGARSGLELEIHGQAIELVPSRGGSSAFII